MSVLTAAAVPVLLDVNSPDLSPQEQSVANDLNQRIWQNWPFLMKHGLYYDGEQRIRQLGISIPPQLLNLHTVAGWPRLAVDVLDERLDVQGFRRHKSTEVDDDLWDIWTANEMEQESELAHIDAFVYGRSFGIAGVGDDDVPLLTVESPLYMAAHWDVRTRQVTSALQRYEMDGQECIALYLPDETIHLIAVAGAGARVFARDQHKLGQPPVVMLTNRQRTRDRYGRSEITPEVMSITDAACRTLLGMEVAREFFAAPQRYILGATEEAFQDSEGNAKSAWETYTGRILALERDEEGNVPSVGQFAAGDPTAYTTLLQMYSRFMAAITGLPPHLLGFSADNPASAEGIRSAEARLDKRAIRKQRGFGNSWRCLMRMALQIRNNGVADADAENMSVLWADPATPTPAETALAMLQQVQMGYMPASSDIIGEKLGYDSVQRARIAADREKESADQALGDIATAIRSPKYFYTQSVRTAEADNGITSHPPKPQPSAPGVPSGPSGGAPPRA